MGELEKKKDQTNSNTLIFTAKLNTKGGLLSNYPQSFHIHDSLKRKDEFNVSLGIFVILFPIFLLFFIICSRRKRKPSYGNSSSSLTSSSSSLYNPVTTKTH